MLLSFGVLDIHFRAFVGKMKCNLLGQGFMEEFRGIWDYDTTWLVLSCVLGKKRNKMNKSSRVVSVEDCDIPAGHEAIVSERKTGQHRCLRRKSVTAIKEVYT